MNRTQIIVSILTLAGGLMTVTVPAFLNYRKEMYALEQSARHRRWVESCEAAGGKAWRGECLEVHDGSQEPNH